MRINAQKGAIRTSLSALVANFVHAFTLKTSKWPPNIDALLTADIAMMLFGVKVDSLLHPNRFATSVGTQATWGKAGHATLGRREGWLLFGCYAAAVVAWGVWVYFGGKA